jgi:hypothetical protein
MAGAGAFGLLAIAGGPVGPVDGALLGPCGDAGDPPGLPGAGGDEGELPGLPGPVADAT